VLYSKKIAGITVFTAFLFIQLFYSCSAKKQRINRFDLVNRHNIIQTNIDSLGTLSVGNGNFAFSADITGMQSFPAFYSRGIPLGTQSNWGWHSFPNPDNYTLNDVYKYFEAGDRLVPYIYQYGQNAGKRQTNASQWLRENPHRIDLGLIGLEFIKDNSEVYTIKDIGNPVQKLDLWRGEITSCYEINNVPVKVITCCHQDMDLISVRIVSDLLLDEKIRIKVLFGYGKHDKFGPAYDFDNPGKHHTVLISASDTGALLKRTLDSTEYFTQFSWKAKAGIIRKCDHNYLIIPEKGCRTFEISALFSRISKSCRLPEFKETETNNKVHWGQFWKSGAAIDFSLCTDRRALELERRVVLSQYLTKIQCSGSLPPQETGLTYNSWYGKFHLEMHLWHSMHFILWNRVELMEPQLKYYNSIFRKAQQTAYLQGYKGVRWPKMVGPDGRESPSTIGPFLIWQQPHIIYLAELLYRNHHNEKSVLEKYKNLVFETADFMASYARWDKNNNRYVLGPALIPAQERFDPDSTLNPSFELAYWYWALSTAQLWKERLNLKKDPAWQKVLDNLPPFPVKDSLYLFTGNAPDSYTNSRLLTDHPIILGMLGLIPDTKKVDKKIMLNSLLKVNKIWDWTSTWGWDFPMAAMNATCLDQPQLALDILLMKTQKNTYLANGHNYQDKNLTIYLPGNGSLLTAVAMMCTYKGDAGQNGFPADGKWNINYENLMDLY
jgi:protein-glucosylgalactosylhydroxylysine glucosidase